MQGKDIAEYRDERLKSVSAATLRRELVIFSHLFEVARKEWGMEGLANPVKVVRLPSGRGIVRERRLSSFEESALLEACEVYGGDLPHIVRLVLETGMRRGEIAGMIWEYGGPKKEDHYPSGDEKRRKEDCAIVTVGHQDPLRPSATD